MSDTLSSRKVSIIIRCYNEEKHIGNLLEKIFQQTWLNKEIIIVDSGSTDNTVEIAKKFSVTVVTITPEEFTFGYSLNQGCTVATGDFFVIASAHIIPVQSDWIEQLVKPFENSNVALVYGRQIGNEVTKFSEHQIFLKQFPAISNFNQSIPYCNNANAAIRRELWLQHKYDETLSGLEDIEWAKWAQKQQYRIAYNAEATIIHIHEEHPKQILNRYMREAVALKKIFPDSQMSFLKFLFLFLSNTFLDWGRALKHQVFLKNVCEIVMMRYYQYLGTYKGLKMQSPLTHEMIVTFYYPRKPAILLKNNDVKSITERK
ncbi:MAG: glycosyltransferase family 2 protein [Ignavibacteria bacterium]|nr:glycosyltransferase family 2 protein [Ignavibacteria bacterium]